MCVFNSEMKQQNINQQNELKEKTQQ